MKKNILIYVVPVDGLYVFHQESGTNFYFYAGIFSFMLNKNIKEMENTFVTSFYICKPKNRLKTGVGLQRIF